MFLLKLLILSLTLNELIFAITCPKGHKVSHKGGCEACPDGYYQSEENHSKQCRPCTKCNEAFWSKTEKKCTKVTNTECKCQGGFVPLESDSATCKCRVGFGLNLRVCSECQHGYFSRSDNSPCVAWKECKSGVSVEGNSTTDVICRDESNNSVTAPSTPNKNESLITHVRPNHPREGARTHEKTTMAALTPAVDSRDNKPPTHAPITSYYIGTTMLIFGVVGLLVLTAVTCKMHIATCVKRNPAVQMRDSLCRPPVEESGADSLSSLKLSTEEP